MVRRDAFAHLSAGSAGSALIVVANRMTRGSLDIWSGSAIIRAEIVNFSVELIEAIDRAFGASGPVGR